jgi:prolyl oligopeptidase
MSVHDYPGAERLNLTEEIHGHLVADPYRWLEDTGDPRTRAWCAAQDELFARWQARWRDDGARERLRRRLTELADGGSVSVPQWRGERRFFTRRGPGQEHEVLVSAGPDGAERVLIDPAALDPSGDTRLDGWFPSAEGVRLAYLLSEGGDERAVLRVLDVTTGEIVDGPVDRARHSSVSWLPGGEAFYYVRHDADRRRVCLHRVGAGPGRDATVFGDELPPAAYPVPVVCEGGRRLWVMVDFGPVRTDAYLADLFDGEIEAPRLRPFQAGVDAICEPAFGPDGQVYVLTDRDAENRRLCVADPERAGYEHWRTVLPEDPEAVLREVVIISGPGLERSLLLALRARHALSELTLHDMETGEVVGEVPSPGLGTVRDLRVHPDGGPFAWFSYTDFVTPPGVYRLDARSGQVSAWASPGGAAGGVAGGVAPAAVGPGAVEVRQVAYPSRDGTAVRMFILSAGSEPGGERAEPDRPRPAILYGYGSFGSSRSPDFNPLRLAWVEAGGVYAIANVRGGGEEGNAWHRAGMRENKQNGIDDLHAAGDYLVDRGWTTRDRLGIHGGSAGGQLVGAAFTQRPGAYAAVLCSAPQLDLVRYERSGIGRLLAREYGSAADPEEFGWLLARSPYHHVRDGAAYPAVLFTVFENDVRVDPMHARKLAAALQHATSAPPGERPVLLRCEPGAGHTGRSVSRSVALWLDQLGFFARQLGAGPYSPATANSGHSSSIPLS